jgi:hypothetical protein
LLSLTLRWLCDGAVIDSVVDVPGDQGGFVRLHFARSGHDFLNGESDPVTKYLIYQRAENDLQERGLAIIMKPLVAYGATADWEANT